MCDFGAVLTGSITGVPLLQHLITAPTIDLMVGIGSAITFIYGEKRLPEILDVLKKQEEIKDLTGYALYSPYRRF